MMRVGTRVVASNVLGKGDEKSPPPPQLVARSGLRRVGARSSDARAPGRAPRCRNAACAWNPRGRRAWCVASPLARSRAIPPGDAPDRTVGVPISRAPAASPSARPPSRPPSRISRARPRRRLALLRPSSSRALTVSPPSPPPRPPSRRPRAGAHQLRPRVPPLVHPQVVPAEEARLAAARAVPQV